MEQMNGTAREMIARADGGYQPKLRLRRRGS